MEKKKYIAFVGDSFCASYGMSTSITENLFQRRLSIPTYTTIVSDHYQFDVAPYGFAGKSWWYSWSKFWKAWGGKLDHLEAIIFTHTDHARINSAVIPEFPLMANYVRPEVSAEMIQANQNYFKYIHDDAFNAWAQEQYFKMLEEKFNKIKTVHFHCHTNTIGQAHLLPGVVFTTPLHQINIGELRGSKEQIMQCISQDLRANHFNDHNNQVMADVIIQALDNYVPGMVSLPIEKFDQPNPNAASWATWPIMDQDIK